MSTHGPPSVLESSIRELHAALESGAVTSVELVADCVNRIAFYDRHGILLNAVPVLNPDMFAEARAADERRERGESRGPLDGIPYTAKDSYRARGLTVAAGSPAFRELIANEDSFAIERLRAAGAVLIGLSNMPPMAAGGMQRGVYGRAESPYNSRYLTSAFASGSSNGSGTATAAGFGVFGLGEETWSSGRAPASNNGLVAYTPSRGLISMRGNWPLIPTMDVVVPHTRTVADMLEVLNVLVADDGERRGDFWRLQPWVSLPSPSRVRPRDYRRLADPRALRGRRLGVPRLYINADHETTRPVETRPSVIECWEAARRDLEALGAEVVEVDFPAVSNYERDRPGARSMIDRGLVPEGFVRSELWDLVVMAWDDFLRANGDPRIPSLDAVNGELIFPRPEGALPDRYHEFTPAPDYPEHARYVEFARRGVPRLEEIPLLAEGLRGLEETRRRDFEEWLDAEALDALVFPAVADVGPADADVDPESAALAWRNGTWVANGNLVLRHLGIPTVTAPMGLMSDIAMPVGLTFAGGAYDDSALLGYAYAFDSLRRRRTSPPRTPPLPGEERRARGTAGPRSGAGAGAAMGERLLRLRATVAEAGGPAGEGMIAVEVEGEALPEAAIRVFVDGVELETVRTGSGFRCRKLLAHEQHDRVHSEWREPYGTVVLAVSRDATGACVGAYTVVGGVA
ncbi:amidase [Leucobacter sp. CSA1]|uniref:Amidase n=1 Tax=Leucobacter chromiisoli TaxID=2796471 RepID=A0A934UV60_9MICO|nr:amidase [Leucobacter chromiisoli]